MTKEVVLPVRIGDVLAGKYRVERVLGVGGMGAVVAARHVDLDELRAIKLMLGEDHTSDDIERFMREARAAVRLKSEHVAKVHDVGRLESGAPYIVLEYLEGSDLQDVSDSRGRLPLEEAVDYVLQACEAIAEAHAAGVVHRDLKPANLFLTGDLNGRPCVKVLDFGISKLSAPGGVAQKLDMTKTSEFMGSPFYMSPEQMVSARTVDLRSDIWSLGVILYELTTGVEPFQGETITELCGHVLQDAAIPPSAFQGDLPHEFDAVVLRCLEKKPAARYQSIRELVVDLIPLCPNVPLGRWAVSQAGDAARTSSASLPNVLLTSSPSLPAYAAGGVSSAGNRTAETFLLEANSERAASRTHASWGRTGSPLVKPTRRGFLIGAVLGIAVSAVGLTMFVRSKSSPSATGASATGVATPMATTSTTAIAPVVVPGGAPNAAAEARATSAAGQPAPAAPVVAGSRSAAAATVRERPPLTPSSLPNVTPAPRPNVAAAPQPVKAPNCNPPFTLDADGVKHAKPECL